MGFDANLMNVLSITMRTFWINVTASFFVVCIMDIMMERRRKIYGLLRFLAAPVLRRFGKWEIRHGKLLWSMFWGYVLLSLASMVIDPQNDGMLVLTVYLVALIFGGGAVAAAYGNTLCCGAGTGATDKAVAGSTG